MEDDFSSNREFALSTDRPGPSQESNASSVMDATENESSLSEQTEENRSNPFDVHLLETLHRPAFTPSVFARVVSPTMSYTDSPTSRPATSRARPKRSRRFRWSIDHIAALNPAQIDEEELPLQEACQQYDEATEASFQAAIDQFFSQPIIAPSPWKSEASDPKPCDPVTLESPWKVCDTPTENQTPGTDLEQSFSNTKARIDEDINSSVYLLSDSEAEDEGDSSNRKRTNFLLGTAFHKSHRTSTGIDKLPSPEISPIKEPSPFKDISPVVNMDNLNDDSGLMGNEGIF